MTRAVAGDEGWRVDRSLTEAGVRCLAADPHDRMVVLAGCQGEGVVRSGDGGATWAASGLTGLNVKALAFSPFEAGVVYAGTKPARMFASRDGGGSWDELDAFCHIRGRRLWRQPAERPTTAYVQAIAVPERDVIVAGIEAGATVVSDDRGLSWSGHRRGSLRDCHCLAAGQGWVVEAGGSGGGAAHSLDGGRTWTKHREGLDRHYGWAVALSPATRTWYLSAAPSAMRAHGSRSAEAAIFRSIDGGAWQRLGGGLPEPIDSMPYALLTDPTAPGDVYACLANGEVWSSTDRGENWRRMPVSLGRCHRSAILI